ncbi:hypothetical protein LIER_27327 [Lithospermum erythrorhizon]|uniref:Uncharacterized protein n=1 Tax=Lithospermum erythrorhizon TaxID=34254 RepID=A0AAV3RBK6_LITER
MEKSFFLFPRKGKLFPPRALNNQLSSPLGATSSTTEGTEESEETPAERGGVKESHTLNDFRVKGHLRYLHLNYTIKEVKMRVPLEGKNPDSPHVDSNAQSGNPHEAGYTCIVWEFFNYV